MTAQSITVRQSAWGVLVIAVLYLCFFDSLTSLGFVGPDEPRYASVARDLMRSGDWVTPRLHGEPWLEKPILYYWAAAAGYVTLGDSEYAARLPSAVSAVLTTLAVGWLARRVYGQATAALVLVVLPTMVGVFPFARAATTDMLFTASCVVAMCGAVSLLVSERTPSKWFEIMVGLGVGFAVLAKGPIGLLLGVGATSLWAVANRRVAVLALWLRPMVLIPLLVVSGGWYVLCATRNPEFVSVFLGAHNVDRFLTPVFGHVQPLWFFGPVLFLGLAPWTIAAALAGVGMWRVCGARPRLQSTSTLVACWAAAPVLFFSLSQSKLPGYVLPAVPPLALLVAHWFARLIAVGGAAGRRVFLGAAGGLLALAAVFVTSRLWTGVPGLEVDYLRSAGAVLAAVGVVVVSLAYSGHLPAAAGATALGVALSVWHLNTHVMPLVDPLISPREAAQQVRRLGAADELSVYELHRAWRYGLEYYLDRPLAEWDPTTPARVIVTRQTTLARLVARGFDVTVHQRLSDEAVVVAAVSPPAPVAAQGS